MAVTSKVYGLAQQGFATQEIKFDTDSLKAMLCTSLYVPDQDTHRYKSSVTNEIAGTGYTAGGMALTGKTVTYDAATNTVRLDCDDVTWTNSTLTARIAVFYKDTGTAATSPLLCWWDFGSDQTSSAGPFSLSIAANGLLAFSTA